MLNAKRGVSLTLAVMMLVTMLACFVLPDVMPAANAAADPYGRVTATYEGGVYVPADNVYFVNTAWSNAPAGKGETFEYTYGDGDTWGNGKTYKLTWGENAYSNYLDLRDLILRTDPTVKNNFVVVLAPGSVNSTGNAGTNSPGAGGSNANSTCTLPSGIDDPTEEQLMNVWYLGPQAGKSPVTAKGDKTVANGRSISTKTEFIYSGTFWMPINGVFHFDGCAGRNSFKLFGVNNASANYKQAIYVDNFYVEHGNENNVLFQVGAYNNVTNTTAAKVDIRHSYFNETTQYTHTSELYGVLQCAKLNISDCVFYNFRPNATTLSTAANTAKQQVTDLCVPLGTAASVNSAFMGDLKGTYQHTITNNSYIDMEMTFIYRIRYAKFKGYSKGGTIDFDDNYFKFIGYNNSNLFYMDKNADIATANIGTLKFTNNYFELAKAFTKTFWLFSPNSTPAANAPKYVVTGNTFKWQAGGSFGVATGNPALMDLSGNLFMDYDGNILPATANDMASGYTTNANVLTEVYASGSKRGGMRELFGAPDLQNSAVACYSYVVQKVKGASKNYFDGYLTVLLKDGETYNSDKFISFNDKDVQYEGLFSDAACTQDVGQFTKADLTTAKTWYAKASYTDKAAGTTATVIYQVNVPTTYRIVCPDGATSYTFNGVTYNDGQTAADGVTANFYQYIDNSSAHVSSSAYSGIANPSALGGKLTTIIVLAPGTYDFSSQGMGKAVCYVGPQFGVSAYDKTLASQGKFANGRSFDPTKEAVLKGTLNPAGDGSYGFMFDGIAFAGSNGISASGTPSSDDQYLNLTVQNCVFATNGAYGIMSATQPTKPRTVNCIIRDCGYDGTGVTRSTTADTSALVNVRANHFLMTRCAILNDQSIYTAAGATTTQRTAYVTLNNGANQRVVPKRLYADFIDNTIYNSRRDGILYTLRDTTTLNANFTYWKQAAELNVKDNLQKNAVTGYLAGIQGGEATGSQKFVKMTMTGNVIQSPSCSTAIISNYQSSATYQGWQTFTDDSVVKDNIFANAGRHFAAYNGNKLNIDDNFFGTYDAADGTYKAAPINTGATGVVKDTTYYYVDTAKTHKSNEFLLTDNANFVTGSFATNATGTEFDGNNRAVAIAKGKITKDSLTAMTGCTIGGIYSDADCQNSVSEITVADEDVYYVPVTKDGLTVVTELKLTICTHENETRTKYTAPDCGNDGSSEYTCDVCGNVRTVTEPKTGLHTAPDDWTCVTEENCTQAGYYVKKCTVCDEVLDEKNVPKDTENGHNYQIVDAESYPANCMKDGNTHYKCEFCLDEYDVPIKSTGEHGWVEKTEKRVEPTCTTEGSTVMYCDGCKTEVPVVLDKAAHQYTAVVTKESTCTEDGIMTYTCANCKEGDEGHSYTEVIPNNGGKHDFTDWATTKKASCTETGERMRTCSICKKIETETISKTPHIYSKEWTIDVKPTNDVRGEKSHHCVFCGDRTDITDLGYCKHEHTDGEYVIVVSATCKTPGLGYETCVDCGYQIPDIIPMLPHTYDEGVVVKKQTCLDTGTMRYTCLDCGHENDVVIPADGHTEGVWKTVTAPSCTVDGKEELRCSVCNELLKTRSVGKTGHTEFAWKVKTAATCTVDGEEVLACVACGMEKDSRVIKAVGHKERSVDTVAATCTKPGLRTYLCTVCGATHTEPIPATGHKAGSWTTLKIATTLGTGLKVKYCKVCGEICESEIIEQLNEKTLPFKDVKAKAWYADAVSFVYGSGLFKGTSDTEFSPNAKMTRGMFVTVLGRLAGVSVSKYTEPYFEDVDTDEYYFGYIEWARQTGIVNGTAKYIFQPDRPVNRQEMCKIIATYADKQGITFVNKYPKTKFKDQWKIDSWAVPFVTACQRAGIISGYEDGTFGPKNTATRAEVAQVIMNFYLLAIK